MMEPAAAGQLNSRVTPVVWWYVVVLATIGVFLAVGAWSYQGLIYGLAEWQFERFGRYFPTLTIALLLSVAAVLLVVGRIVWGRMYDKSDKQPVEPELAREARALDRLTITRRFFRAFAVLAAVAGAGTFVHLLQFPGPTKAVTTIDLSSGAPVRLKEGSVIVRGIQLIGPIARTSEDITFSRSSILIAPVGQTRLENGSVAANLFVQVTDTDRRKLPTEVRGVLRRNALPSEVAVMYRAANVPVISESSVVFLDSAAAREPTLNVLITFMALAIGGTALALLARRREREFVKQLEQARRLREMAPS